MIDYIEYKNKKYPFRVGYRALKKLKEKHNISSEDLAGTGDIGLEVYETILYWSLVSGAKAMDEKLSLKETDMEDVLDESMFDFIEKMPKFFPKEVKKTGAQRRTISK